MRKPEPLQPIALKKKEEKQDDMTTRRLIPRLLQLCFPLLTSLTVFIALTVANNQANAQVPEYKWAKSAIGTGGDRGNSICTDADGNIIVTGRFRSPSITFGDITLTNSDTGSSADVFIVKYDSSANVLWAKSAGGKADDMGMSCCTDASGNIILIGGFECPAITFGKITLTNVSKSSDIFIVKYSPDGEVLWAKSAGGETFEGDYSTCAIDSKGNIIIASSFNSPTISFGSITLTNSGTGSDTFIAKYSSNGDLLWVKGAVGPKNDMSQSCSIDAEGNIIVCGYFTGATITFESTTLTNAGGSDLFVVKYDANGNLLWAKSVGGPDHEVGTCSCDESGNVVAAGSFFSPSITFGSTTLTNKGIGDIFVLKFDLEGSPVWAKSAGGIGIEGARGCYTEPKGNTLVIGSFSSPLVPIGYDTLTNSHENSEYMFIAEYSANGEVLWAKSTGGANRNVGRKCTYDSFGNIFATGSFDNSTLAFGTYILSNSGDSDMFIVKLAGGRHK